jgi:hypothetical protein
VLQLTPLSIIFIATCHVDFRKGINGLAAFCKNHLSIDPMNGALFLFYNKARTTIKILAYDGQGFTLFVKRLSRGTFKANPRKDFWLRHPHSTLHKGTSTEDNLQGNSTLKDSIRISHKLLQVLINNGDPATIKFSKDWRPLGGN